MAVNSACQRSVSSTSKASSSARRLAHSLASAARRCSSSDWRRARSASLMAVINFRLLSKGPTYGGELEHDRSGGRHLRFRFDPDSRPADLCVALRVTRSLSVSPRGAFERRGSSQPDLYAVGRLAVAREKAPSDEVVDNQAVDRERDVCHPAPKVRAVAA